MAAVVPAGALEPACCCKYYGLAMWQRLTNPSVNGAVPWATTLHLPCSWLKPQPAIKVNLRCESKHKGVQLQLWNCDFKADMTQFLAKSASDGLWNLSINATVNSITVSRSSGGKQQCPDSTALLFSGARPLTVGWYWLVSCWLQLKQILIHYKLK